jgi:hypothetical protein
MSDTEMADERQQQQPEVSKNRKHRKDKRQSSVVPRAATRPVRQLPPPTSLPAGQAAAGSDELLGTTC